MRSDQWNESQVDPDARWQTLLGATDERGFCNAWLDVLVERLARKRLVCVLRRASGGEFYPLAQWPRTEDPRRLGAVVQLALDRRQVAEIGAGTEAAAQFAFPVEEADSLLAVVAVEFDPQDAGARTTNMREVYWASAWLRLAFSAFERRGPDAASAPAASLLETLRAVQQGETADAAALELANRLAADFSAQRVSVALRRGSGLRLAAISNTPWFDPRSALASRLELAAAEAAELQKTLSSRQASTAFAPAALAALAYAERSEAISLPLRGRGARPAAAVVLERPPELPFAQSEIELLEEIGVWCGPALELLAEQDRWWTGRAARHARELRQRVADPRRPALKLALAGAALVLCVLLLVPVEERIAADAVVEGERELTVAAAFDGFVGRSFKRAGDLVQAGETLALLDDRPLRLDQTRWEVVREQNERRFVDSLSRRDRAGAGIADAARQEAEAQLGLARYRLERTVLKAEVDALIVSGDLSQQLGAPVRKGDVLFRLAPRGDYRVVLRVDERDIRRLAVGQRGELVLAGDSSRERRFQVRTIGPAEAAEGLNTFRVEATLESAGEPPLALRPGMEGVAKVAVDRAPLAVAWTRRSRNWLQTQWFRWTP